ncbi:MAG: exo-alpha-sialidase [Bacteroidales bacterium]|nr:exo-alpha-sialidase [Bacteroidales bacterium]
MRRILLLISLALAAACGRDTAIRTMTVYEPSAEGEHYGNNAVLTYFKGAFYCMWQSSATDEDAPDTHLVYSRSRDGRHWPAPETLVPCTDSTFASSGGWATCGDTLVAFVNLLTEMQAGGTAHWLVTTDGRHWSEPSPVRMADGKPMEGILEQDPHLVAGSGPGAGSRLVGAAHFRPGLKARPIYTDDLSGRSGWHIGTIEMEDHGTQSRGIEPSLYRRPDGAVVMLFRDQASTFRKLASVSTDRGETWTTPELTELTDGRSKQCAGNLPDGRIYVIGNPVPAKDRTTLAIQWSDDGRSFTDPIPLRTPQDLPPRRYEGKYKTPGYSYPKAFLHGRHLYVSYSENKERIVITRIKIADYD